MTTLEARQRPNGELWDLHLKSANGEPLMHGNQGYDKRSLKRAIKAIRVAMALAEIVFVERK